MEYATKISSNIQRKTPLQELLNQEKVNTSRVKCHKKRQLLDIDKGKHANFNILFPNIKFIL